MESNEKFRGQTDSIILFILSKGARHADELKIIIDEYFTGVKIGTLYSIITRLKNQKLITEYRASSFDGSRRNVENHFYTASGYSKQAGIELVNDSYIAINELI